jgi:hypothetical protein
MAARLLEVPIALVPLIEHDRQFFKACVGLPSHSLVSTYW